MPHFPSSRALKALSYSLLIVVIFRLQYEIYFRELNSSAIARYMSQDILDDARPLMPKSIKDKQNQ